MFLRETTSSVCKSDFGSPTPVPVPVRRRFQDSCWQKSLNPILIVTAGFRFPASCLGSKKTARSATPHSQRSFVDVTVKMGSDQSQLPIELLISEIETTLNTPVQAAVKRPDEQQFAYLNGTNLMFCEDAARRIQLTLDELAIISGYHFEVNHLESLHPHDAVAQVSRGIDRGIRFSKMAT